MAESEEKVIRKYVGKESQGFYPGVPARDLTADDWKDLTPTQRKDVDGGDLYRKVEAAKPEPVEAEKPAEKEA